jgi:hypothetical protein
MIQLIFENADKIVPEWEHEEERLAFRLSPVRVSRSTLLHGRMEEAGDSTSDQASLGLVATHYEGDVARQVRVILELPDEVWDALAEHADELLDEG